MTAAIPDTNSLTFTDEKIAATEQGDFVVYQMGSKTFRLDKTKARARLAGKMVINGQRSAVISSPARHTSSCMADIESQRVCSRFAIT